jgi:hypothetical protein
LYPSPQMVENVILVVVGLLSAQLLWRLVKAVELISIAVRLYQNESHPASTKMPIANKELEAVLDKTESGRYARLTFPDSMRPFKDG